jgi:peroxiredoxin Q/BCP
MLAIGARAPEFTLPDADGQSVSLHSLLARGPLILYFYPADFTAGCTREACQIRDLQPQIQASGLQVAGVSPQGPESHKAFRHKHRLPFILLSDIERCVVRMYGVRGPFGLGVRRATFLINTDRQVLDVVVADMRIGMHARFVREAAAHHTPAR